jgi:hypothetical protein
MPDLQVLTFKQGVPSKYGDLNLPLNSDGTFEVTGPAFLSGIQRATQDLVRALLTLKGTNNLALNYGTSIKSLLNARNSSLIGGQLVREINYMLGYLGDFNSTEDPSEQISNLISLKTTNALQSVNVELKVSTLSGETTGVTIS